MKVPKLSLSDLASALQKQKWIVPLLGLISLMLLIWLLGPYLGFGTFFPLRPRTNRLILILLLAAVWLGVAWWRQMKAARVNQELVAGLQEEAADQARAEEASKEEVAVLRERFQTALQVFRKGRFKNRSGRQYLYELPWYVIIGPPGAGKTTALVNSGLEFPLEARVGREPVQGIGGTRNCDWWFSNDAVLVDTAGRYTTQDSQKSVDSAAWTAFLKLLRKTRPRCPVNGVIVAMSLSDIMLASEAEREAHSEAVRQRIQELARQLGVNPPIYVMFTKCDLVAGFQEFFDDLGRDQRGQVWGMTFPPGPGGPDGPATHFGAEFDGLLTRVGDRMLWRVQQERDLGRRALISAFPQQLANLRRPLDDFLKKTFGPSRYEAAPLLRGVYLTSGTQEGAPIDRLMNTLADTFGLDRQALASQRNTGRSYFITRLFKDVIFPEAGLAGVNVGFEHRTQWLRRAAYVGVAAAVALVVFAWSTSFTRNQLFVHRLDARADDYRRAAAQMPSRPSLEEALPALDAARTLTRVYDGGAKPPWTLGMGLYQGYRLDGAAESAYRRAARRYLLPQVHARLEQLIRGGLDEPEELQKLVALYLMLANPETLNRELFRGWATADWTRTRPDPDTVKRLALHLDAALGEGLVPQPADPALMARATRVICRIPLDRLVYSRLEQVAAASDIPGFDLNVVGGPGRALLASASGGKADLPGLYTRDGYRKLVKARGMELTRATIDENRRICEDAYAFEHADPDAALRKVRERYFAQYVSRWDAFLADATLVNLATIDDAVRALDILGGPDSPLTALAKAAAEQTAVEGGDLASLAGVDASDPVARHFTPLRKLVTGDDKTPAEVDAVLADLQDLKGYLAGIAGGVDPRRAGFEAAKTRMGLAQQDVISRLRQRAQRLPAPAAQLVDSAAVQGWGTVLILARAHVNEVWRASVVEPYRRTLENRYPLFGASNREATVADFGAFFGAGGTLDAFFTAYLEPFVDARRWKSRVLDNRSLGLSSAAVRQLRRGAEIRAMMFQDGGQKPVVRFAMKPMSLDADVRLFQLDLAGQSLTYRHGPARATRMTWPGPDENGPTRIVFEQLNGGRLSVTKDGPWSWFRLLDQADVAATGSPDRLQVVFHTGGLKSAYELRASSASNPFRGRELTKFRCPEEL